MACAYESATIRHREYDPALCVSTIQENQRPPTVDTPEMIR